MPTSKTVTIVAVSDFHGDLSGIQQAVCDNEADVLVIAGDIQTADVFTRPDQWFNDKFYKMIGKLPCEVVAIPGNHDFYLASHLDRGSPSNFHLLIDQGIVIEGLKIYGTPWVPWINGSWVFECDDEDLEERFKQIPKGLDILITHSPPLIPNKNIDVSLQHQPTFQRHFGSKSLYENILVKQPRIMFCGHIHSGDHTMCSIKNPDSPQETLCFNVSRVDERYKIGYKVRVVKVCGGEITANKENVVHGNI